VSRMNITRQEIRFALLVTAGVLILGSLPYAFGYLSAPARPGLYGHRPGHARHQPVLRLDARLHPRAAHQQYPHPRT
jgi:hypothetical protein